jgi:hypothetical protein
MKRPYLVRVVIILRDKGGEISVASCEGGDSGAGTAVDTNSKYYFPRIAKTCLMNTLFMMLASEGPALSPAI